MFRFENLEIWKRSIEMTDKIFDIADTLEAQHKYRFAEQLRSAALSITNNIAEGSGSLSRREFKQFINYAHRSLSETANRLIICNRRKFITESESTVHLTQLEEVSKMLVGFFKSL